MAEVYINRIATAVPAYDIHRKFIDYAPGLLPDENSRALFRRMARRAQIDHRYSFLKPHKEASRLDSNGFYAPGHAPDTPTRMRFYERNAFPLARQALDGIGLAPIADDVTHLIVTSCTGFYAPGLDLEITAHYGLRPSVERTLIGFMGCHAAISALKAARHIVRSEPAATVVILSLELCTLHLLPTGCLEKMLSFLLFSDGCAAALVSAAPSGLEIRGFQAAVMPDSSGHLAWRIGGNGFDMVLSGKVPQAIEAGLPACLPVFLDGASPSGIRHWAIHPGGRTVLDAVQNGLALEEALMRFSREVLRRFGNMSSPTIMFVLRDIMKAESGQGCAMAFGPGLTVESMRFESGGQ